MKSHPHDSPAPLDNADPVRRLLVFCGARAGRDHHHAELAAAVGRLVAERGVCLVYGGGSLGLMGEVGRAAIRAGGEVEGIIPHFLRQLEVAEPECTNMIVTQTLHARKELMFARADAVLALPGGLGTLDELVEVLSWRNLRLHAKPVWLLGSGDFWAPFMVLLGHLEAEGFLSQGACGFVRQIDGIDALAALLPRP